MKINKNSWHYKLYKSTFVGREMVPDKIDLCRYCHTVFWQMLGLAIFGGLILFMVGGTLWLLYLATTTAIIPHPIGSLEFFGAVAALIVSMIGYRRWMNGEPIFGGSRSPGLFSSFLSAKKQKICPLVEFTDENP